MSVEQSLLLGEFPRRLDERFRLSIPGELAGPLLGKSSYAVLVKERPGSLSLWHAPGWQARLDAGVQLVQLKIRAGKLEGRTEEVQSLGRLLSTRHRKVRLAGRGRLVIPEGFREFLGVEPGGEIFLVGAAVCLELWRPDAWFAYLQETIPRFTAILDRLAE